jgi:hypothetical protein
MAKQPGRHPPRLSERQIAELHQAVNRARRRFMHTDTVPERRHDLAQGTPSGSLEVSPLHDGARVPLLIDRRQR